MQNVMNRRWLLASYPEGMPSPDNWTTDARNRCPIPDPVRSSSKQGGFPSILICGGA